MGVRPGIKFGEGVEVGPSDVKDGEVSASGQESVDGLVVKVLGDRIVAGDGDLGVERKAGHASVEFFGVDVEIGVELEKA